MEKENRKTKKNVITAIFFYIILPAFCHKNKKLIVIKITFKRYFFLYIIISSTMNLFEHKIKFSCFNIIFSFKKYKYFYLQNKSNDSNNNKV